MVLYFDVVVFCIALRVLVFLNCLAMKCFFCMCVVSSVDCVCSVCVVCIFGFFCCSVLFVSVRVGLRRFVLYVLLLFHV